jgi:uncharacterized Zn finger protein
MVKVLTTEEYSVLCPVCGERDYLVEVLHYDDGSTLMTEQCECGHYSEAFRKPEQK